MSFSFQVAGKDVTSAARLGVLSTSHGSVDTPAFFPVATRGSVKGLTPAELDEIGVPGLLVNSYHLFLRPGASVVQRIGGVHAFMGWNRPVVTDSGGFQIYSLKTLRSITDEGVMFRSHLDGSAHFLTPEDAIAIQEVLGSDVMMVLDQCSPHTSPRGEVEAALRRTLLWAERSVAARKGQGQALFGILQGGMFPDLRAEGARQLVRLPFDGFAVGGVGVGEGTGLLRRTAEFCSKLLPEDRPRYLMGVGEPGDLLHAVRAGYDLFDCVLPTRNGRNGTLFTSLGKLSIKHSRFKEDPRPVDPGCLCYCCRHFSRAYLRHLFLAGEMLSATLNTIHNLSFYLRLMERVRASLCEGRVGELIRWWAEASSGEKNG